MPQDPKPGIALVTRKTRMQHLLERWATRGQVKFALAAAHVVRAAEEAALGDRALARQVEEEYGDLEQEDATYAHVVRRLAAELDFGLPVQIVDRGFLPTFDFARFEAVVVVGQDGLVANAAKYVGNVPIVAVNPDPGRIDGVLLPFYASAARGAVSRVLQGSAQVREVTLAEAVLHDGQRLLAFNDLFVGCQSHVSARYRLSIGERSEPQSSSGLLVATGAGSTGWLSSVFNMTGGVLRWLGGVDPTRPSLSWEDRRLLWVVREPFVSKNSRAELVIGSVDEGSALVVESMMPASGVIFSDGVEADYLPFNSGATARIGVAAQKARLVVP